MDTALQTLHSAHNATFGQVAGSSLPLGYGDFAGEVAAMRNALGVLDRSADGILLVRGEDAPVFLSGITTNHVTALAVGGLQPNLVCANKGKILFPVDVLRLKPEQYLLIAEPGQLSGVAGHLEAYHIREAVEIGRVPLVRLDLLGPEAQGAVEGLGFSVREPFGTFREGPLITVSHALGPLPRVVCVLPEAAAAPFAEAVLSQVSGARLVGLEAFEEMRIRAGVPRFHADYDEETLPAEAALYSHLSFDKGCYVGQEVHARLHHRGRVNRKLMGVEIPEAPAAQSGPGSPLYLDGEEIGVITSLSRQPVESQRRGIAMMRFREVSERPPVSLRPDGPAEVRLFPLSTDLGAART